jgi:membrane protein implicated in regulation of membrane protease activity
MSRLAHLLEEPETRDPAHYIRRVHWLAVVYVLLFVTCAAGDVLLIWRGELFVTLAQRSNVETLTIAFCIVMFAYFALLTAPGCIGALRLLRFRLRRDRQAAMQRALGKPKKGSAVALDRVVIVAGEDKPWQLELRDEHGSLGRLCFEGVTIRHRDARHASNTVFGFLVRRIAALTDSDVEIVDWESTDEDSFRRYRTTTDALATLGRALKVEPLPVLSISDEARATLERELCALCPGLRAEALLPDWEFAGEHKLPIIPEPLGIVSLSRSAKRVDPLAALAVTLGVVATLVAVTVWFLARPPWVPGS